MLPAFDTKGFHMQLMECFVQKNVVIKISLHFFVLIIWLLESLSFIFLFLENLSFILLLTKNINFVQLTH